MKFVKILFLLIGSLTYQLAFSAVPDSVIVIESKNSDWLAGTLDSVRTFSDTLALDTMRTYHYNFTNCGATGRLGPSQANCNSAYLGTDLDGAVTVIDSGTQRWTTPEAGIYHITAEGAGTNADNNLRGAVLSADFEIAKSADLDILVGQMGTSPRGGSGGSFVTYADTTPIIIAGGAAGMRVYSDSASLGSTATSGQSVSGPGCSAVGGTAGYGGQALGGGNCSSAGGGLYGDGQGCAGGLAFVHGGGGGNATYLGGFGGGGGVATSSSPGGGGGYSGGSVHYTGGTSSCAGGGGSFIASGATHVLTSNGYYDNSNTFNGDTITNFGSWHFGHGDVSMNASKYVVLGNRVSPVHDISTPMTINNTSEVTWIADAFTGTSLTVETRLSMDAGSTWSAWDTVSNGSPIPGLLPGFAMDSARVQTRMTLATASLFASPQVHLIKIVVVNDSTSTGINKFPEGLTNFTVYPNPFNNSFKVGYSLTHSSNVTLRLISSLGQEVLVQEKNFQSAGLHTLEVNTADYSLSRGIYWIEIQTDGQAFRDKLVH